MHTVRGYSANKLREALPSTTLLARHSSHVESRRVLDAEPPGGVVGGGGVRSHTAAQDKLNATTSTRADTSSPHLCERNSQSRHGSQGAFKATLLLGSALQCR